jgi:hypothetical protein
MGQVVENLPSKNKDLSSNYRIEKKKKTNCRSAQIDIIQHWTALPKAA